MGTSISQIITVTTPALAISPGPVTGLAVSNLAPTSLTLTWAAPTTGNTPFTYQPQQSTSGGVFVNIGGGIAATTLAVSGLVPNTAYQFRIVTSNASGSSTSAPVSSSTLSVLPSAPTGLAVLGTPGQTDVNLQWNAPSAGTPPLTYQVSSRTPSGSGAFTTAAISTSALAQDITGLMAGTSYDFIVSAANLAGPGPQSVVLTNVSTAGIVLGTVPGPATGLVISSLAPTGLTLTWTAPVVGTAPLTYQVQQAPAGSTSWVNIGGSISATTLPVTSLTPNTAYQFQILTTNAAGSSLSATVGATTLLLAPNAPSGLAVVGSAGQTSVALQWLAPTVGTAPFTYQVSLRTPTGVGSFVPFSSTTPSLTQTITGLSPGTSYDFQISAANTAGSALDTTPLTNVLTAVATGTVPGVATGLVVTNVATTSLTLTWTAPATGTTPFSYQPQQTLSGGTTFTNVGSALAVTTLVVSGLTANTAYQFHIVTTNSFGSSTSASVSATTLAVLPAAPTTLAVVGSPTQTTITLQWGPPASGSTPFTYQVSLRTPSGSGAFIPFGSTTTSPTQTITGLVVGSGYDFQVNATNIAGAGPQSTILTNVSTAAAPGGVIPAAPTNLIAGTLTASTIAVSWTTPATGTPPLTYTVQYRLH